MKTEYFIFILFGSMFVAAFVVAGIIKITSRNLEQTRRERYPEYFDFFDEAIDIISEVDCQTKQKATYFNYHYKLIYEGLRDGECTVEYFEEYLARLNKEYIEFATWFEAQQKEAKRLFREADIYAKLRDLKWGYLY